MSNQIFLGTTSWYLEDTARIIYKIENNLTAPNKAFFYESLTPIFEKNKLINEDTWYIANEKLVQAIEFFENNPLSYIYYDEYISNEIPYKILIYGEELKKFNEDIFKYDEDYIKFIISSVLCDLSKLVIKILLIDLEIEIHKLSKISEADRKIELNKIIYDTQLKLTQKNKIVDKVTKTFLLIKRKKLNKIFNTSVEENMNSITGRFKLINEIVRATKELQGQRMNILKGEKNRTAMLATLISKFVSKDESSYGKSGGSGNSAGEIDIKIENSFGEVISLCEAFNLKKSFDRTIITNHIQKLDGYDANGLDIIFVIVFSELSDYLTSWKRYVEFIPTININNYKYIRKQDLKDLSPAKIQLTEFVYLLNHRYVSMFHLFVDMR
jgi:hypothetical protein